MLLLSGSVSVEREEKEKDRAGLREGTSGAVGCCCAAAAAAGSMMERRADCRAKFVSRAKRTSDREARNAGEEDPLGEEVWNDDVCAVERSVVVVVVLLEDKRGESGATTTGGKLDRWME